MIKSIIQFTILLSFGVAIMRIFNWDPFGFLEWTGKWFWYIFTSISDWVVANPTFREIFSKPPPS